MRGLEEIIELGFPHMMLARCDRSWGRVPSRGTEAEWVLTGLASITSVRPMRAEAECRGAA